VPCSCPYTRIHRSNGSAPPISMGGNIDSNIFPRPSSPFIAFSSSTSYHILPCLTFTFQAIRPYRLLSFGRSLLQSQPRRPPDDDATISMQGKDTGVGGGLKEK
jgi:hypothetical protein